MKPNDHNPSVEHLVACVPLDVGDTLRIVDPHQVLVHVAQGRVWITEECAPDDVMLAAGHWFRLARPGAAVVEALAPAVLLLTSPRAEHYAREFVTTSRPPLSVARRHPRARERDALSGLRGRYPEWLLGLVRPTGETS